jgi:hypothetical protein
MWFENTFNQATSKQIPSIQLITTTSSKTDKASASRYQLNFEPILFWRLVTGSSPGGDVT